MTQRPCDYPAAHSMDTAWFAVDDDGCVALFDTGEAGAVPAAAYLGEDAYGVVGDLCSKLPYSEPIADFEGLKREQGREHVFVHGQSIVWPGVIAFLRDEACVRDLLDQLGAVPVRATVGRAHRMEKVDHAALERLHAGDNCLGCFFDGATEEPRVAERGIFRYSHATDNWMAGPYARAELPATPVRADQLPAEVRERAVRFSGKFASTVSLQPAELWSCESWGPAWLASDDKTIRPFGGRENEYLELREEMGEEAGAYVWLEQPREGEVAAKKPWWRFW